MGSCVSLHRDSNSAVKLHLSSVQPKNDNLIISSPVKHNAVSVNGQDAVKFQRSLLPPSRDDGSKDEAFFDSQPWLESDCEEDFLSVNGDFTPSLGNTPVHHKFSSGKATVMKPPLAPVRGMNGSVPEPSPKKRLSELFKESLRHREDGDEEGESSDENEATDERSSNGKDRSVQCCLPRLRSSHSLSDKKKKTGLPNGTT